MKTVKSIKAAKKIKQISIWALSMSTSMIVIYYSCIYIANEMVLR